jgi:17beta-estradiol 17-dehydrogenase / very-long-chain 3-oxoacyl-CoA reductase
MFSKSLDLEYRQFGISCHNQAPAYVATKMSKIRKPTMDAPSPANWVKAAIAHIGYEVTQCPFPCVTPLSPSFFPLRIL